MQMPPRKKCRAIEENGWFREWKRNSAQVSRAGPGSGLLTKSRELLPRDAAFFDFVEKSLIADAELLGRAAAVPSYLPQRILDHRPLSLHRGRLRDVGEARRDWFSCRLGRRRFVVKLGFLVGLVGRDRRTAVRPHPRADP